MEEAYMGEIRLFAGNFAPVGWAICDGSELSTVTFSALFQLLGTTYGGDGLATFGLPDLRGRVPIGVGQGKGLSNRALGELGGAETVAVTSDQLPAHSHIAQAHSGIGNLDQVGGNYWSGSAKNPQFTTGDAALSPMNSGAIAANGKNQPHDNMLPFLPMNFIICLDGIYPTKE